MSLSEDQRKAVQEALRPLANIWLAYLENNLDDGARRFWGSDMQVENETSPRDIEMVQGRGGRCLLTLDQCREAQAVLQMLK